MVALDGKWKRRPAFQIQLFRADTRLLSNKSEDAICQRF
jgi:hypothetical protein